MGGQAVVEGVMMRGERTWAVAIRTPEGDIEIEVHDAPTWAERWSKIPLVRGVTALCESMSLGMRALTWSANKQVPEEDQLSSKAMGWTVAIAISFFAGIFIVMPALAANGLGDVLGLSGFWFHVAEGALRLGIFLGYLSRSAASKTSGACSSTTAPSTRPSRPTRTTSSSRRNRRSASVLHVRCGTNFLLTVMVVTIVVYAFFGRPGWVMLVASRVVLIPLIAGLSYEIIRFAAKHMQWRWVRILMRPGLLLQKLTTREPTLDQVEVAVASLRAVLTAEQLSEVDSRAPVPIAAPIAVPAPA